MYCLYMFCRGILVIGPKRDLKIVELGRDFTVAPDDRTLFTGRPDSAKTGFPVLPLKRSFLFKSLYKAFLQAFVNNKYIKNVQKKKRSNPREITLLLDHLLVSN